MPTSGGDCGGHWNHLFEIKSGFGWTCVVGVGLVVHVYVSVAVYTTHLASLVVCRTVHVKYTAADARTPTYTHNVVYTHAHTYFNATIIYVS